MQLHRIEVGFEIGRSRSRVLAKATLQVLGILHPAKVIVNTVSQEYIFIFRSLRISGQDRLEDTVSIIGQDVND